MESSVSGRVLKRAEKELAQSKVVLRHLPSDFTKEKLLAVLHQLPPHNYFSFVEGNPELGKFGCARAYINFKSSDDVVPFRDQHDGLVLETEKGVKYRLIIELAPYQIVPRANVKPDRRCGTIHEDAEYKEFVEKYEKQATPLPSVDVTYLHEIEKMKIESLQATPLTTYLRDKYLVPRARRGSGQRNKVLYASGSGSKKKNKEKSKEFAKSKGKGFGRGKDGRGKEKKGKGDKGAESTVSESTKVIIAEKKGQNGHDIELSRQERGGGSKSTKQADRTKQPDQTLYVPGRRDSKLANEETKKKDGFARNHKESGRDKDYPKHTRSSRYNDRHDNSYNFKDDDDGYYQGPDYSPRTYDRKGSYNSGGGYDTRDEKRRYQGRGGRNHERSDSGSKTRDGGYRVHK